MERKRSIGKWETDEIQSSYIQTLMKSTPYEIGGLPKEHNLHKINSILMVMPILNPTDSGEIVGDYHFKTII